MSSNSKVGASLVVAIVLVGIAAYVFTPRSTSTDMQAAVTETQEAGQTSGSATSDDALAQDSSALDAQIAGVDSANAHMNQSFSDQAGAQSY